MTNAPDVAPRVQPSWRQLLRIWGIVSLVSFGGGQAVQLHVYRELVTSRTWLSPERWAEVYAICRIVPGMNLIAVALVTGYDLAGCRGAGSSVVGLLGPSVVITVVVTALYSKVEALPLAQAAFHGVVLAAAAMSVVVGWRLFAPSLRARRSEGLLIASVSVAVLVMSGLLVILTPFPVYGLLIGAGLVMAVLLWGRERHRQKASDD